MGLTRKEIVIVGRTDEAFKLGGAFDAQLLADPSAPSPGLRRLSLTGDGTLISCTPPG
jgi:hypothetical protein